MPKKTINKPVTASFSKRYCGTGPGPNCFWFDCDHDRCNLYNEYLRWAGHHNYERCLKCIAEFGV